jgi:putative ABC transport system ATP-binding protein
MLRADRLSKVYRTGAADVPALTDVSAVFPPSCMTAILGPSGSGKSTLLNLLAGFDTPTSGTVTLDGQVIGALSESERADLRLRRFGFVFQSFNLVSVLDAVSNVALPMALAGVPRAERTARAMKLLERFGVAHRSDHLPHRLSGGERQRVALARALANDPAVVFADEPTGNLDSKSGEVVVRALRDVAAEGRTVVIVTHDRDLAELADARIELRDGEVRGVSGPRADDVRPADTAQAGPVGAA